jgi:hypothetical protein
LTVDISATGRGDDRDIGMHIAKNAGPVARGVLVENGAVGGVEQVHERAAVAAIALHRRAHVLERFGRQTRGEVVQQLGESRPLLLPGETEVADTDLAGLGHLLV